MAEVDDLRLEVETLRRRLQWLEDHLIGGRPAPVASPGCICPPGAELNCRSPLCLRSGRIPMITTGGTGTAPYPTPPASGGE